MRIAVVSEVTRIDAVTQSREAIGDIHARLSECLTQLDDMNVYLAAAHLSACLDVLSRDFNLD